MILGAIRAVGNSYQGTVGEAAASTATSVGTASGIGVGIVGGLAGIFGC